MRPDPALIAGAGPTGLVLALALSRLGVSFRIIDKALQPGTTTRAFGIQPRTLEFYDQIDKSLTQEIVTAGIPVQTFNIWSGGKEAARPSFGKFGEDISPYPYMLIYPQDLHEQMLIRHLEKAGVTVERGTELIDFTDDGHQVSSLLKKPGGAVESAAFSFVCGCDGAHSAVRKGLGLGFPGGTYEQIFYVADVEIKQSLQGMEPFFSIDNEDFTLVFPMKSAASVRLVGIVPSGIKKEDIDFEDVRASILRDTGFEVAKVNWFSSYSVHHRMAENFSKGRAFLLGDAAHIHSPAGAQGMNTGIGDAVNLAWKLADAARGKAQAGLLATYAEERMKFARKLLRGTDRAFRLATDRTWRGRFFRGVFFPKILPFAIRFKAVGRFMFKTISQTGIEYRGCALSEGRAGGISAGDRLPWVKSQDNFSKLSAMEWQVHVYGTAPQLPGLDVPLHVFDHDADAKQAGFKESALYLIRPDAYVAFAGEHVDALKTYLRKHRE